MFCGKRHLHVSDSNDTASELHKIVAPLISRVQLFGELSGPTCLRGLY